MRYFGYLALICILVFGFSNGFPQKTCTNWCKTPPPSSQAYCCDDNPLEPVHGGHCPPIINTFCPAFASGSDYKPPQPCNNDGRCARVEKCCFDGCLKRKVCKPSVP